jgi:CheY-like chemotaxis protein
MQAPILPSDEVRVVVVDDNADAAESMAEVLRLSGCEVRTAGSAAAALELIERYEPHCVLFDIMMPGISGDELCVRLRARYGDDIVLVAVSGYSENDPRVGKGSALADHFFTKPVDPKRLIRLLRPGV